MRLILNVYSAQAARRLLRRLPAPERLDPGTQLGRRPFAARLVLAARRLLPQRKLQRITPRWTVECDAIGDRGGGAEL